MSRRSGHRTPLDRCPTKDDGAATPPKRGRPPKRKLSDDEQAYQDSMRDMAWCAACPALQDTHSYEALMSDLPEFLEQCQNKLRKQLKPEPAPVPAPAASPPPPAPAPRTNEEVANSLPQRAITHRVSKYTFGTTMNLGPTPANPFNDLNKMLALQRDARLEAWDGLPVRM